MRRRRWNAHLPDCLPHAHAHHHPHPTRICLWTVSERAVAMVWMAGLRTRWRVWTCGRSCPTPAPATPPATHPHHPTHTTQHTTVTPPHAPTPPTTPPRSDCCTPRTTAPTHACLHAWRRRHLHGVRYANNVNAHFRSLKHHALYDSVIKTPPSTLVPNNAAVVSLALALLTYHLVSMVLTIHSASILTLTYCIYTVSPTDIAPHHCLAADALLPAR